jgi:proteasome regulatory subunit
VALTEDANGATLRAIAMEAGMCAVREEKDAVYQKDFEDAIKHIMNPEGMVDRYSEGMFA